MKSNDREDNEIERSRSNHDCLFFCCQRMPTLLSSPLLSLSRESRTKEEDGGEGIGIINGDVRPSLLCNVFQRIPKIRCTRPERKLKWLFHFSSSSFSSFSASCFFYLKRREKREEREREREEREKRERRERRRSSVCWRCLCKRVKGLLTTKTGRETLDETEDQHSQVAV